MYNLYNHGQLTWTWRKIAISRDNDDVEHVAARALLYTWKAGDARGNAAGT